MVADEIPKIGLWLLFLLLLPSAPPSDPELISVLCILFTHLN